MVDKNKNTRLTLKKKQKVLLPTLKEQQRYLVYKIISGSDTKDFKSLHEQILAESSRYMGIFDGAKAGLIGVKFNAQTKKGIIRVNNNYVDKLKVCMGLIKELFQIKLNVDCVFVSGMLNKAESKMNI